MRLPNLDTDDVRELEFLIVRLLIKILHRHLFTIEVELGRRGGRVDDFPNRPGSGVDVGVGGVVGLDADFGGELGQGASLAFYHWVPELVWVTERESQVLEAEFDEGASAIHHAGGDIDVYDHLAERWANGPEGSSGSRARTVTSTHWKKPRHRANPIPSALAPSGMKKDLPFVV